MNSDSLRDSVGRGVVAQNLSFPLPQKVIFR